MESEPRKPKIVKIQLKMVSQASEGDLMPVGSLYDPPIGNSWFQNRTNIDIVSARDQPCNNFYDRNLLHRDRKLLHRVRCHHMTR